MSVIGVLALVKAIFGVTGQRKTVATTEQGWRPLADVAEHDPSYPSAEFEARLRRAAQAGLLSRQQLEGVLAFDRGRAADAADAAAAPRRVPFAIEALGYVGGLLTDPQRHRHHVTDRTSQRWAA
ncbi:MAG TPA: hypothetical protein VI916_02460 [Acidimicrobiia bacterium]|nr:hypothetical protein [Acidimicrobiia bacterium]